VERAVFPIHAVVNIVVFALANGVVFRQSKAAAQNSGERSVDGPSKGQISGQRVRISNPVLEPPAHLAKGATASQMSAGGIR
jgi:hypothetical protein